MQRKIFLRLTLLIIGVIVATIAGPVLILQDNSKDSDSIPQGIPKAVIVDQLFKRIPNELFQNNATNYLKAAGYEVDIFTTEDITVDFYKKLPERNYKFIVIRSLGASEKSNDSISLFTGEKYQEDKYVSEQLFGQVKRAIPTDELIGSRTTDNSTIWFSLNSTTLFGEVRANGTTLPSDEYFVITPKFVKDSMIGKFPETVFILDGSNTLENDSMAKSLIERGATTVIGWDNKVTNFDSDQVMLALLEKVLIDNVEVRQAVDLIGEEFDSKNLYNNATLRYYPLHFN